jgi:hypothetical protein
MPKNASKESDITSANTSKLPSLPHLSAEARAAQGKSLRNKAPRSAHAQWHALKNRPDPVEILSASNVGLIEHLVPIRFGCIFRVDARSQWARFLHTTAS